MIIRFGRQTLLLQKSRPEALGGLDVVTRLDDLVEQYPS